MRVGCSVTRRHRHRLTVVTRQIPASARLGTQQSINVIGPTDLCHQFDWLADQASVAFLQFTWTGNASEAAIASQHHHPTSTSLLWASLKPPQPPSHAATAATTDSNRRSSQQKQQKQKRRVPNENDHRPHPFPPPAPAGRGGGGGGGGGAACRLAGIVLGWVEVGVMGSTMRNETHHHGDRFNTIDPSIHPHPQGWANIRKYTRPTTHNNP